MMQSLMDNPQLLQSIIMGNPQMRAVIDANPQLAHVLSDPATLRQSMRVCYIVPHCDVISLLSNT
jgi:ubiquilin